MRRCNREKRSKNKGKKRNSSQESEIRIQKRVSRLFSDSFEKIPTSDFRYQIQSFHKKGKRMTARRITIISNASNNKTVLIGIVIEEVKAALDSFISNKSWGKMSGNPS